MSAGPAALHPLRATAEAEAGFLRDGGVGPVAGDAVNPSMGAWPRHPCRGHSRNRPHPAFDRFSGSVGMARGVRSAFSAENGSDPRLISISDRDSSTHGVDLTDTGNPPSHGMPAFDVDVDSAGAGLQALPKTLSEPVPACARSPSRSPATARSSAADRPWNDTRAQDHAR